MFVRIKGKSNDFIIFIKKGKTECYTLFFIYYFNYWFVKSFIKTLRMSYRNQYKNHFHWPLLPCSEQKWAVCQKKSYSHVSFSKFKRYIWRIPFLTFLIAYGQYKENPFSGCDTSFFFFTFFKLAVHLWIFCIKLWITCNACNARMYCYILSMNCTHSGS